MMRREDLDATLAAANPVRRDEIDGLAVETDGPGVISAEDLLSAITEAPYADSTQGIAAAVDLGTWRSRSRGSIRRGFALAGAVGVVAVGVLVAIGSGGPAGGPTPAIGSGLARLVEASPPILLNAPGWRVERADESFMSEGSIQFFHGENGVSAAVEAGNVAEGLQNFAELQWRSEPLEGRLRRVASFAVEMGEATVLETTARIFVERERKARPFFEATAVWEEEGQVLVLRSFVPDLRTFEGRLAALRRVDAETWLDALRGRVVEHENGVAIVPPITKEGR